MDFRKVAAGVAVMAISLAGVFWKTVQSYSSTPVAGRTGEADLTFTLPGVPQCLFLLFALVVGVALIVWGFRSKAAA